MNNNAICAAIVARLQADQGGGALFATGGAPGLIRAVYRNMAPPNAEMPYVVFDCKDEATENTFTSDVLLVRMVFAIFIPTTSAPSVMDAILDRIYGDATTQSSGLPSFGLHRHPLNLTTGTWTGGTIMYTGSEDDSDRDRYLAVPTFQMYQSRSPS